MSDGEAPPKERTADELRELFDEIVTEETIDVRYNTLRDEGLAVLVDWMKEKHPVWKMVTEVDVGGNFITAKGCPSLVELIKMIPNVTDVDFRDNNLGKEGIYALHESLVDLRMLKQLSFNHCSLWDYGAGVVMNILPSMTVTDLCLVDNFLTEKCVDDVMQAVAEARSLRTLTLDFNRIGDGGAAKIAAHLSNRKRYRHLHTIGLSDNSIGDDGAAALGEAFGKNGGVPKIDLSVNHIGTPGAIALAKGLMENTVVEHLDVAANELYDDGTIAMVQCLRKNRTLRTLDLTNEKMTDAVTDAFVDAIKNNTTVTNIPLYINEDMTVENKEKIYRIFWANKEARRVAEERRAARMAVLRTILWYLPVLIAAIIYKFLPQLFP
eukprot:Sspe_Gene.27984::Locus_12409_Transcript_1_1_Confidence_1.000_Length_1467::g.27984::m.27984